MEANQLIANVEVFSGNLPDLNKADAAPLELNGEYWTPEKPGEKRRMFFKELRTETTVDQQTGKDIELLVAYFVEVVDGRKRVVRQAGRRLTAVFESFSDKIKPGMAFEITYQGKVKNKSNSFMSDAWRIVPLSTK